MLKKLEYAGRRWLIRLLAWVLRVPKNPISLPKSPKILVIRLDERVGNMLLLTPLLNSLRHNHQDASIHLLAHGHGAKLLAGHPALDAIIPFDKRKLLSPYGPIRILGRLRAERYDLCLDAANPTNPSTTQAILTAFSKARFSIGPAAKGFGPLYGHAFELQPQDQHEIAMRLRALDFIPQSSRIEKTSIAQSACTSSQSLDAFIAETSPYGVVNIGTRQAEKTLSAEDYAKIAQTIADQGWRAVLTWGPAEKTLAQKTQALFPQSLLAPPTRLPELATVMANAKAVVSGDTGPMHLAVAVGTPTCAIFRNTDPARYGYHQAPHHCIDDRGHDTFSKAQCQSLGQWLSTLNQALPKVPQAPDAPAAADASVP